jgi:DNA-binding MarR family transcriptional regulator
VVLVVPSEDGRRLHARVRDRANDLLCELIDTFDAEDRERLASLMERLVAAVDARRGTLGTPASAPPG